MTISKKPELFVVESHALVDKKLARKFAEAQNSEQGPNDFIREFLGNFLSKETRRAYVDDLNTFFEFLSSGGCVFNHPRDITAFHFQYYRDFMLEKKLAPATINRRLVCLRSFVKWSVARKLIDHNPLDAVKLPKVSTLSPTVAFNDDEVTQILSRPDILSPIGSMHRLMLALLFHLGLRRSELVNIKLQDIFEDRGHLLLKIIGKGNKERLIPISEIVKDEIIRYVSAFESFTQRTLLSSEYLLQAIPAKKNNLPLDGSTVFRVVTRYAKECAINKKISPHSCRATVISHLLDTKKAALRDVATFAGHTNITTTERYDKRRDNLDKSPAYKVDFKSTDEES